ncbi:hypothetical protein EMIHUDRAFT_193912 [Emiliania huxleyi CCMP1516]|uniref:F-box domain-containing protein n=2 Tax=Emiliania huxleyi TaxID=2903 RepID=A0A0D3L0M2_EMIH1|nr:hypothetical protein EMIHUDRAFT_193912 [Emiliania huxleyi CCMP1516]EOD41557.1 hypothetical protein EMIHUDRAFT_193912 [Emiliania huxleyi CCMP1516]|eukprot:XP_005793986.1 hypothetical protein EMIHUDRAFT_193912 [Emiliania huxleyi CCMP1516]
MIARTVFKPSDGGYVAYKKANHAHAVKRPNCMFEWWREYNPSPGMPAPPHLHAGGVILDDDAGALVWARLRASPATAQRASGVCKEWRQYALAKTGRLRSFRQDTTRRHSSCAQMRATEATIKAVAESPVHKGLEVLSGHPSLRSLTLFMEGFTPLALPAKLPELAALHLKTSVWAGFDWRGQRFTHLEYPKLEEIIIEDGAGPLGNGAAVEMTMGFLHVLRTKFPLCSIKLTKTGLFRGIRGAAAQQALQEPGLRQDVTEQKPLVLPQGDDWNRAFDDYEVGPDSAAGISVY